MGGGGGVVVMIPGYEVIARCVDAACVWETVCMPFLYSRLPSAYLMLSKSN